MHVGIQTRSRWSAEVQTENQNWEEIWCKRFWRSMVVCAKWVGLGWSHTTISRVYKEWSEKEKIFREQQFCRWK